MKTHIKDFCEAYKTKLKNDKDIAENPIEGWKITQDCRDRITMSINIFKSAPGYSTLAPFGVYRGVNTIVLDSDDLKYLYDKYSKRLVKELEDNINEIKKEYE